MLSYADRLRIDQLSNLHHQFTVRLSRLTKRLWSSADVCLRPSELRKLLTALDRRLAVMQRKAMTIEDEGTCARQTSTLNDQLHEIREIELALAEARKGNQAGFRHHRLMLTELVKPRTVTGARRDLRMCQRSIETAGRRDEIPGIAETERDLRRLWEKNGTMAKLSRLGYVEEPQKEMSRDEVLTSLFYTLRFEFGTAMTNLVPVLDESESLDNQQRRWDGIIKSRGILQLIGRIASEARDTKLKSLATTDYQEYRRRLRERCRAIRNFERPAKLQKQLPTVSWWRRLFGR